MKEPPFPSQGFHKGKEGADVQATAFPGPLRVAEYPAGHSVMRMYDAGVLACAEYPVTPPSPPARTGRGPCVCGIFS